MISFAGQPVLITDRLRLEPLGPQHFEGAWRALDDVESRKLTGTHSEFTPEIVRAHLERIATDDERADWAIVDLQTGDYLGEVVLNNLDQESHCVNYRIGLVGGAVFGKGYGTEATKAVIAYAFEVVGLHRIDLGVFAFNPRAIRSYEKCGFIREGLRRDSLLWDGEWHDEITMSILSTDPRPS